jgi:hypothetical protein
MLVVLGIAGAAALAMLLRRLPQPGRRMAACLAVAPFAVLMAQSYGGEGLLRCYFFALPFAAMLIGSLLPRPSPSPSPRRSPIATLAVAGLVGLLVPVLLLTRDGNDAFESTTMQELRTVNAAIDLAPAGSAIVSLNEHFPTMSRAVAVHRWISVAAAYQQDPAAVVARIDRLGGAWVIITRSQEQYGQVSEGRPRGWTNAFASALLASGHFRLVSQNQDAVVLANLLPLSPSIGALESSA